MKYKDGVILRVHKIAGGRAVELEPSDQVVIAMKEADFLSNKLTRQEAVVTSVLDGVHSKNSLHYSGNAFDLRVWIYTPEQIAQLAGELKKSLGKNYDVVFEGDHIHVEYDPK